MERLHGCQGRSKFRNVCRIFVVSNKKNEGCPVGWRGGSGAGLVDGGGRTKGLRGQGRVNPLRNLPSPPTPAPTLSCNQGPWSTPPVHQASSGG